MPQFKVYGHGRLPRNIEAQSLDHAKIVCDQNYPDWMDIYTIDQSVAENEAAEI